MAKGPRGKLTEEEKRFVVRRLAQFDSPKEAVEALKEEFRVQISPQAAEHYDPNKRAGRRLAVHLRELFEQSRKKFIDYIDVHVPHANKSVRIRKLARAADAFENVKNYMGMARMLEQLAREVGGTYTNRTELTGRDRGPIKFQDIDSMTDDQVDAEIRRILGIESVDVHPAPESTQ